MKHGRRKYVVGWVNDFKLAKMKKQLKEIDEWMRRRVRMDIWKMWKKPKTRYTNLKKLGLNYDEAMKAAMSRKGYWRLSNSPNLKIAISNKRLEQAEFIFFSTYYNFVRV